MLTTEAGKHLQHFIDEMTEDPSSYHGHQVKRVDRENEEEEFASSRSDVITKLLKHIERRFASLKQDLIHAATSILDTSQWPSAKEELATYANTSVDYTCRHFRDIIIKQGCNLEEVMYEWQEAKLFIGDLPPARRHTVWRDIFNDPELAAKFPNFMHIVEVLLVLPLSTAACERGFSCMKQVKTDWRASLTVEMLTKLMFIVLNGPAPTDFRAAGAVKAWWKAAERTRRPDYME
ncbi:PREDICTED: uncharacterized protein LOC106808429 [Priapulus caudatus]|uniref:Uncharacterized protein LOC106808429 n=1 Tax=Priapulus caudatus TaxID=37621 RepID=A0ABM1E370_PRICU|nr:PREDICTED: uncharacterized protein LOC106808429 [Priapulus caudatus]